MFIELNIYIVFSVLFLFFNIIVIFLDKRNHFLHNPSEKQESIPCRRLISSLMVILFSPAILDGSIYAFHQKSLLEAFLTICINIKLFIIIYIVTPYIHESLGKYSVAQLMHENYGIYVGYITASTCLGYMFLFIVLEIDLLHRLLYYLIVADQHIALFITLSLIILYLTIRSTSVSIFASLVHFFTFGTLVPGLFLLIWNKIGSRQLFHTIVTTYYTFNPSIYESILDYKIVFGLIPISHPAIYQTLFMARSGLQVRRALQTSFAICLFLIIISFSIAALAGIIYPYNTCQNLTINMINYASYPEFKLLLASGIIIISLENIAHVLHSAHLTFSRDIYASFQQKLHYISSYRKGSLLFQFIPLHKLSSYIILLISTMLILYNSMLVKIYIITCCYTYSAIFPFFIMSIVGFRTNNRVLSIALCAGIFSILLSNIIIENHYNAKEYLIGQLNLSLLIEIVTSTVTIIISICCFNIYGEWAEFSTKRTLYIKYRLYNKCAQLVQFIKSIPYLLNFNAVIVYCNNNNSFRYQWHYYQLVRLLTIILTITVIVVNRIYLLEYIWLVMTMIIINLILLTNLFLCQSWDINVRQKYIGVICYITIFYTLIITNTILLFISDISIMSILCFIINIIIMWSLVKWNIALFMTIFGIPLGILIFKILTSCIIT